MLAACKQVFVGTVVELEGLETPGKGHVGVAIWDFPQTRVGFGGCRR